MIRNSEAVEKDLDRLAVEMDYMNENAFWQKVKELLHEYAESRKIELGIKDDSL